ncbi:hypothetical protein Back11_56060 [Paenibacillus baekrokdamisoli]|uniref:Uncharacterized protein n=1 Tax=Paenibacillus baekrokdamisoli TaxID=1712516 RepID=A0A3G9JEC9_9BACL|nr:DUF1861 family protein [Paenibacillus baekrokdamisoli]MBB3071756.1 hypothetical protein [Paenibacillus baekrokdamisoli]BBH24261.1 hypothetical protein Back11_56060 [Paenibacillus baekrokdamisoli]
MALQRQTSTQSCSELLEQFENVCANRDISKQLNSNNQASAKHSNRIIFEDVDDKDVYNITAAFLDQNDLIIAGRVESRDTELSQVIFFRQEGEAWRPHPHYRTYELQDPFMTRIKGELILGGVRVTADPMNPKHIISWVTEMYRGASLDTLKLFLTGPEHMKDVRVVELAGGEIGVLTRPQGEKGGRGKIGFFKTNKLEAITAQQINDAPVFQDQFVAEEWGGANEPHLLANGLIGVLGHIASFDSEGDRHYYAMTFAINPQTMEKTPMKLIARRSIFPEGPTKRPDLVDVIFSGGLVRKEGGMAALYVGASDAAAYVAEIPDPFLEYEQL